MASRGTPAWKNASAMRYGVHGSWGPGFSTSPICSGITGSHRVGTPGQVGGRSRPHTGRVGRQHRPDDRALRLVADGHAALLAEAGREHVEGEPARQRVEDA